MNKLEKGHNAITNVFCAGILILMWANVENIFSKQSVGWLSYYEQLVLKWKSNEKKTKLWLKTFSLLG